MKKNNFSSNNKSNNNNYKNTNTNLNNDKQQDLQKAYDTYSKLNENDLMNKMFEMAKISKQQGQLDNAKIDQFFNNVSGMLSAEQRKKLKGLLDMLKD